VFINTTDENGHYERMIHPDDLGAFFVTVSSPGYLDDVDIIGTEDNFGLLDLDIPRFLVLFHITDLDFSDTSKSHPELVEGGLLRISPQEPAQNHPSTSSG